MIVRKFFEFLGVFISFYSNQTFKILIFEILIKAFKSAMFLSIYVFGTCFLKFYNLECCNKFKVHFYHKWSTGTILTSLSLTRRPSAKSSNQQQNYYFNIIYISSNFTGSISNPLIWKMKKLAAIYHHVQIIIFFFTKLA